MTRPKRIDPPGGWHHVMSRGVNRDQIFFDDDDRHLFVRLLSVACKRFDVEVHAFCLMTNHFHLLVRCPTAGLSDAMHHLLSVYAQAVNDRVSRTGHLFAGRFVSRWITDEGYLANVVRYVHRNPLDIVGIDHPADYRWSSHAYYLGRNSAPDWLHVERVGGWFSDSSSFDQFVSGAPALPNPAVIPDRSIADDFVRAVDLLLAERSTASRRHLPAQRKAVVIGALPALDVAARAALHSSVDLVPGTTAYRQAQYRAGRLLTEEAELMIVLELVLELFGPVRHLDIAA